MSTPLTRTAAITRATLTTAMLTLTAAISVGAGWLSFLAIRDLATLVGQHDVPVRTLSYGDGRVSESVSLRRQDILEPAAIRALPPGTALLLATGIKPALIHLTPWYAGPRAAEITAAQRAAQAQIRDRAIECGPAFRNPPAAASQEPR